MKTIIIGVVLVCVAILTIVYFIKGGKKNHSSGTCSCGCCNCEGKEEH